MLDYKPTCPTCGGILPDCPCQRARLASYNPSASYGPHSHGDWERITVAPLRGDWPGTMSLYKWYGPCKWCGAMAVAEVARTSLLTGQTYVDSACENHAAGWLPRA